MINGQHVELIPTEGAHAGELYDAVGGNEKAALFDYMPYGPFDDVQALQEQIRAFSDSKDPLFWTIRDLHTSQLLGWLSMLRIDLNNRVVEIGHITYSPQVQRTTAATEAWYLLANKAVRIFPTMRLANAERWT